MPSDSPSRTYLVNRESHTDVLCTGSNAATDNEKNRRVVDHRNVYRNVNSIGTAGLTDCLQQNKNKMVNAQV